MNVETILEKLSERDLLEPAKTIAARHHISVREMFAPGRVRPAPKARAEFYVLLKEQHGFGAPRIGLLVGRDQSTITAAMRSERQRPAPAKCVAEVACDPERIAS